jgi:hypothetical protein
MSSSRRRFETVPVWIHARARADSRWPPAAGACISGGNLLALLLQGPKVGMELSANLSGIKIALE